MDEKTTSRECPVCGIVYAASLGRLLHGRQTTCSRQCSYILRTRLLERKTRLTCSVCGTEMVRPPSQIKGKHGVHFCSRACHYAGRSLGLSRRIVDHPYDVSASAYDGWRRGAAKTVFKRRSGDNYVKTEETRAKLSIATARSLAERKPGVASKLEDQVAVRLGDMGAEFIRQHPFHGAHGRFACVVDFWFPDRSVALEVNGTFWHADPRVYPIPLTSIQEKAVRRYRRKVQYLTEKGIRIVELWELDFEHDPAQAVLEAYTAVTAG